MEIVAMYYLASVQLKDNITSVHNYVYMYVHNYVLIQTFLQSPFMIP